MTDAARALPTAATLTVDPFSLDFLADPYPRYRQQLINQGVASGELTKKEAVALKTEQRAIKVEKKAFKADGKVTAAERAKLRRDQNQASRHIYNKKHNAKKPA